MGSGISFIAFFFFFRVGDALIDVVWATSSYIGIKVDCTELLRTLISSV